MKVKVKLYGTLGSRVPGYKSAEGIEVEIPEGATVRELLNQMAFLETGAAVVIADGRVLKAGDKVQDGVPVDIFQSVSGGS